MTETAPFGTWVSKVTTELATERSVGLSYLTVDGAALYWLEARPGEGGRSTIQRWTESDGTVEVTPTPWDVGSRVHEYGGGAYAARAGRVVVSDKKTGQVWLIEAGRTPVRATATDGCRYADFAWDPMRERVLAVCEDHRGGPASQPVASIVAIDLTGDHDALTLVQGADFLSSPRVSPDGDRLAWLSWDHPDMPWDTTRLWVAPLDQAGRPGDAVLVAGGHDEAVLQPEWMEDGELLFSSDRTGLWNLYRWRGGAVESLGDVEAEIGGGAWQFATRHYARLPDRRIVCAAVRNGIRHAALLDAGRLRLLPLGPVAQSPVPFGAGLAAILAPADAPPSVVVVAQPEAGQWRTLQTAGPTVLEQRDVSLGEPVDFPTAGGGESHAFFYPPRNSAFTAPAGATPPLVVLIHGGPTSMATNAFSLAVQWWTSRGFAVADVNYRGSTGFGRSYRQLLNGQWGVSDVEDCVAVVHHLAATGRIDPDRVAIRGGSAGGFTVLAALTSSDVFKAGASLYGIGDLMLLAHDTHKFESRYLDRLVGPLPEAAEIYRARSPIHRIDAMAAPVIFFQGLDDRVVPPNQAATMVDAMERTGLPVAYYTFAGEGHGFRRAETIRRVLDLELGFYARIFGFAAPGLAEEVVIRNRPAAAD